MATNQI